MRGPLRLRKYQHTDATKLRFEKSTTQKTLKQALYSLKPVSIPGLAVLILSAPR